MRRSPASSASGSAIYHFPQPGDEIVCLTEEGYGGKLFAKCWTTKKIWDDAHGNFVVRKYEPGKTEPALSWTYEGVLSTSVRFPSDTWEEDGTILRKPDGTCYVLTELFEPEEDAPDADPFECAPQSDPRIPLNELPEDKRNGSLLN